MQRVIAARVTAEARPAEEIIRANYTDKAALRRWVKPGEVADAVLFLASAASASITVSGSVLTQDEYSGLDHEINGPATNSLPL
jgi:NAD(P)-dependent dehydrogenase (short-subunit alcohol dehydrogenase family)